MALAIAQSFDDDVLLSLGVEGNNDIAPATAVYTTPFTEQLQLALDPHNPNLHIDLGEYSCSGKNQWSATQQHGFRKLTRKELMQLMRRLRANPNVVLLNLMRQGIDGATMQVIAAAIAALSELQVLLLAGA